MFRFQRLNFRSRPKVRPNFYRRRPVRTRCLLRESAHLLPTSAKRLLYQTETFWTSFRPKGFQCFLYTNQKVPLKLSVPFHIVVMFRHFIVKPVDEFHIGVKPIQRKRDGEKQNKSRRKRGDNNQQNLPPDHCLYLRNQSTLPARPFCLAYSAAPSAPIS